MGQILKNALESNEFCQYLTTCDIKHYQISAYAAYQGSFWERLIKVVKQCLYKSLGRAKLTYFELLTELSDIQCAINNRPLSY